MTLKLLLVDDEPLARSRLRTLLADCRQPAAEVTAEAGNAAQAMDQLRRQAFDAILLDVHMPGVDGLALAQALRGLPHAPAVVFVTAYAEHAVSAFDLDAVDYLTKPVRLDRLQAALARVERALQARGSATPVEHEVLIIQDRGRTERVPVAEVLYFKAELKYVTVRTAARSYILDGSLSDLEERHGSQFLRVHRNALVAKAAVRELARHQPGEEELPADFGAAELESAETWSVRVAPVNEWLQVSRRQLAAVREALRALAG